MVSIIVTTVIYVAKGQGIFSFHFIVLLSCSYFCKHLLLPTEIKNDKSWYSYSIPFLVILFNHYAWLICLGLMPVGCTLITNHFVTAQKGTQKFQIFKLLSLTHFKWPGYCRRDTIFSQKEKFGGLFFLRFGLRFWIRDAVQTYFRIRE